MLQNHEQNQNEINDFFAFIEQLLIGKDNSIVDVISTTVRELLVITLEEDTTYDEEIYVY